MLTRAKKKFNVEVLRDLLNEQLNELEIDKEDPDSDYAHVESCRDMVQSLMELKVISTSDGDWHAMYAGDKCIGQGHEIEYRILAKYLGLAIKPFEISNDDMETVGCHFPDKFSDIPFDLLVYCTHGRTIKTESPCCQSPSRR